MEDLLNHLETKIKQMLYRQSELKDSNSQLQSGKQSLLVKQQETIDRIESLISRLKAIESI